MNTPTETSVFHSGELAVQEHLGVRERVATFGPRMMRPILIEQHREFYAELPFIVLGSVDGEGRPWASILSGAPGFLTTPDETTLRVAAQPPVGDPLRDNLAEGADIGVLGVQLETRRRNRMAGRAVEIGAEIGADGFAIKVLQSFGNCPQYIQTRDVKRPPVGGARGEAIISDRFDAATQAMIGEADTLFIASAYRGEASAVNQGADVSHRGGKPGFVKVEGERGFVFPDFSGNNIFNTIGNLSLNPKAGFLFPDFETGDLVTMTGGAEIIWDGPEVDAFEGAQRLIRFAAEEVRRLPGGLGMTAAFREFSPVLERTGAW